MPENVTATAKETPKNSTEKAIIQLGGKTYELPVVVGSENEKAIDVIKKNIIAIENLK